MRMKVAASHVGVIGGSIAGCAAAIALARAGCKVTVFERSRGELKDRGSGIAMPGTLVEEAITAGYLPTDYPTCSLGRRLWLHDDGSPLGRVLWEQPGAGLTNNWGVLWRSLRANVPQAVVWKEGARVEAFEETEDGVTLRFSSGTLETFDLVVAADGYRSIVRPYLNESGHADFSGYVMWRGNFEESRAVDRSVIEYGDAENAWQTVAFPGGHSIMYMVPGFMGGTTPGTRRVNWGIYAPAPEGLTFDEPGSLPPGTIDATLYADLDRLLNEHFPPAVAALFRLNTRAEVSLQPVYDEVIDRYVGGRLLLAGDAGCLARPHTASGATKALQDALALEQLTQKFDTWEDVLPAYDAERVEASNRLVELGRRIGSAQVEATPDWPSMTKVDFEQWTAATLAGEQLYFYGTSAPESRGP